MTTQATPACPIQISVVLDSGVFLTHVDLERYPHCEIGYFAPEFMIYGDWKPIDAPSLSLTDKRFSSREIDVRHVDGNGNEKKDGVVLSEALRKHLLRRDTIYPDPSHSPPVIDARFDWIFKFYSGFFRCSSVKDRCFKMCNGYTHQPSENRRKFKKIAHDVVIHFELSPGERLEIAVGNQVLWNSSIHSAISRRFDIEVIAPHATAENYFRDAFDHKGDDYWLPNQGDPDPVGGRP